MRCLILITILATLVVSSTRAEERVAGGHIAPEGDFPYVCSLRIRGGHECGCTIISDTFVLTAARCCEVSFENSLGVWAGSTHVNSGGFEYPVATVIRHLAYNLNNLSSPDIALVQLSSPLLLGPLVQPVTLPAQGAAVPTANGIFLGWGFSAAVGPISPDLLQVDQRVLTGQQCLDSYVGTTTTEQLCSEGLVAGQGLCDKDMGGPLVVNNVLEGIASWKNTDCSDVGSPAVFVRVSMYRDWILQNSGV